MPNTVSGTLTASTVATVNIIPPYSSVIVYNLGSTAVYGTSDNSAPTIGGAGCFVVPAGSAVKVNNRLASFFSTPAQGTPANPGTVIKLISSGTPAYTVDPGGTLPGSAPSVTSVASRTGAVTLAKSDVGLGSVDNTADTAKPISTATQAGLDGKQPLDADLTTIAALTASGSAVIQESGGVWTAQTPTQVKTSLSLAKADVGLGSVDNTSDAGKPVSTAQQTALNLKIDTASLSSATPAATAAAGTVGVATTVARGDHAHAGVVVNTQTFTNTGSNTWNKPSTGSIAIIDVIAGGGGGGAGRRGAASSIRSGGAGGGSGGRIASIILPLSALGSSETVTVGIGGTAGTTASSNDNNGGNGGNGGNSSFGTWLVAVAGSGGGGGTATGATGGSGGSGDGFSASGVNSSATGAAGSNANSAYSASAGGPSGGGVTSGDAVSGGGAGAGVGMRNYTGAGSAGSAGNNGGTATNVTAGVPLPGASGGGGGSSITGVGGNGAAGGLYGAGGAGGGASLNGSNSGAGGAGAQGIVQVVVV